MGQEQRAASPSWHTLLPSCWHRILGIHPSLGIPIEPNLLLCPYSTENLPRLKGSCLKHGSLHDLCSQNKCENSRKGSCAASHNWGLLQAQAHSGFPSPLEKKQVILLSHSEANQDFSRKISKISTFIKHAAFSLPFFPSDSTTKCVNSQKKINVLSHTMDNSKTGYCLQPSTALNLCEREAKLVPSV